VSTPIKLIVGLGNPGQQYENTRHNAGVQFLDLIARRYNASFSPEAKFSGITARITMNARDVRLIFPTDFMNNSGSGVAAIANFFKLEPEEILVAHDELDLLPGSIRLKQGGGHGGHNGLRDIISKLGNEKNFFRLRIGIGHPGNAKQVTNFVLGKPQAKEQALIDASLEQALEALPQIVGGEMQKVMNSLHRYNAAEPASDAPNKS